jgi:hypothetical protein
MIGMAEMAEIAEAVEEDLEADLVEVDLAEEDLGDEEDLAEEEVEAEDSKENLLKCMMLPVINVEKNVKFHLDPLEISLFFAVIVSGKVREAEVLVQEVQGDHLGLECLQNN